MPMKPVDQLTKLERLKETVALQRLRAKEGMQGYRRTDLEFLRSRSATGSLEYAFRNDPDPWVAMIEYYFNEAGKEYDRLKMYADGTERGRDTFQRMVREKGLTNVATYRIEARKHQTR